MKIFLIPARSRSQRIKLKNIKSFHGKPIIYYPIKTSLNSNLFDRIIVSTDSKKIAAIAKKFGAEVPFLRPKNLSNHKITIFDVIKNSIYQLNLSEKDIFNCEYIYFTHGHPDHLNPHSIKKFKNKKILLPDHIGLRIYKSLKSMGYNVNILKDRKWNKLSDNISVMSIADYNQDAILLLSINNKLFINSNDAVIRNCRSFIKKKSHLFDDVYLLSLSVPTNLSI